MAFRLMHVVAPVAAGAIAAVLLVALGYWARDQRERWHGPPQVGDVTAASEVLRCVREQGVALRQQDPLLQMSQRIITGTGGVMTVAINTIGRRAPRVSVVYLIREPSLRAARGATVRAGWLIQGRMALFLRGNWLAVRTADSAAAIRLSSCIG